MTSFSLAVDRDFKSQSGEKETDFIDIVAWRSTAEFVSKYFTKGRMAVVEGRLQLRDWTDKDGNKRRSAEVVADNVYFGDSKRDGATGGDYAAPAGGYAAPVNTTSSFSEIDDEDGVFLTFDDGPTPGVTEWILSTLDKYDAKATFFVLGKNVEMYPDLYKRILDAGHKVGNHTYSHQKGWGMSLERYTEDVDFANDLIHSELFRPPYARITPAQARFLGQRYKLVMWDIISRDYNRRLSPRTCLKNVTKHLAPGAIVVFHDSEKAFRNMRYALPRTLEKIRQMGLKCKAIEL